MQTDPNYSSFENSPETERLLRRQASMLKAEQEASIDAILVVDENRRVVSFNHRFCEIFHIPAELSARGDDHALLAHVSQQIVDVEQFLAKVNDLYDHPQEIHRGELSLEDGRFLDRYSSPIHSEEGEYFGRIWYFRDDTERRRIAAQLDQQMQQIHRYTLELEAQKLELEEANAQMEEINHLLTELATTDGLTGLNNHRAFQERLAEEFARSLRYHTPLSIIMLDVDDFKHFNDAHGHPAGDVVLKQVAHLMCVGARLSDVAARYGGEEFILILPQTPADAATLVAERLRKAIENAEWTHQPVTASFGVSTITPALQDTSALIAQADAALYRSKHRGRNCVTHSGVFTSHIHSWH
ncbi:MAG: diguanylate cyclase [Chthonomonadaceae bacterium]|nr:diguanylate cyclase [Chthonomonadaceae bacterium]